MIFCKVKIDNEMREGKGIWHSMCFVGVGLIQRDPIMSGLREMVYCRLTAQAWMAKLLARNRSKKNLGGQNAWQ